MPSVRYGHIRNWPKAPDPRSGAFAMRGTDCLGAGPWKYFLESQTANGPWQFLNNGVVVESSIDDVDYSLWLYETPAITFPSVWIELEKRNPDAPFVPGYTLNLTVTLHLSLISSWFMPPRLYGPIHLNSVAHSVELISTIPGEQSWLEECNIYPVDHTIPTGLLNDQLSPPWQ